MAKKKRVVKISKPSKIISKKSSKKEMRVTKNMAIVGLVLNVIVIPGLGSLICGKKTAGIWQLVLSLVGVLLSIILIGIPMIIAAWIWGLITGIRLIQEASD